MTIADMPQFKEKNIWVAAAYQTLPDSSLSNWGRIKYMIPFADPGSVTALTSIVIMTKYGKIARK